MQMSPSQQRPARLASREQRSSPVSQRELVAASLLVRPDRHADLRRVELSWRRA